MHIHDDKIRLSATDLANHLGCAHLSQLDLLVTKGDLARPLRTDPVLELLVERGEIHEQSFVSFLRDSGKVVYVVDNGTGEMGVAKTLEAMERGADVIVQGRLENDVWVGRPDLLMRVERPSILGEWCYEVADTKLALNTRAGSILQLCLYSDLLTSMQDVQPVNATVIKPGEPFATETFRLDSVLAYYRFVKRQCEEAVAHPPAQSYPEPVAQCEICNWWSRCNQQWRDDDHLSFVAGIQKLQIEELRRQGVTTLEQLATANKPLASRPERGSLSAYEKVHKQAQIQFRGRTTGQPIFEFLNVEPDRGFCRLPRPDAGDVFFDIEGDSHAPDGGLEYLLGYVLTSDGTLESAKYEELWALDHRLEKRIFEEFIDRMMDRWAKHPGMHIYHYAPYEQSAMKRLSTRHATRELEVDQFLRGKRFVDLYAVVRQGIRASVESYSIKKLEPYYSYNRLEDLADARHGLHHVERAIELGFTDQLSQDDWRSVALYNKDDCLSTLALRNWLEERRSELLTNGVNVPRPQLEDGTAGEGVADRAGKFAELFNQLVDGLPELNRDEGQQARWLLAHLLEYFRREDKCVWWDYFRINDLEHDELLFERKSISGLSFDAELPTSRPGVTPTHRYRFPIQEVSVQPGDALHEVAGGAIGEVSAIDYSEGCLDIRKRADSVERHPRAVFAHEYFNPDPMPESLTLLAETVISAAKRNSTPRSARYDLLARRPPRLHSLSLPLDLSAQDAALQLVFDLDHGVLPIQGPPGTGKTHLGAEMIRELAAKGHRVGVTAVSHKVIANLLHRVYDGPVRTQIAHRSDDKRDIARGCKRLTRTREIRHALNEGRVVGGTAWAWSRSEVEDQLDCLFVDEAGQMSLAMALAAGRAAKNIILLGDPQQLEQPQRGSHPEGADVAALKHLIGDHDTIPFERGLFLDETWRLHPTISKFTSEQYYDGRLQSRDDLEHQLVIGNSPFAGKQLVFVPVVHSCNKNRSSEEVERVEQIVLELTNGEHYWLDPSRDRHPIQIEDILVVAPYNAQVASLRHQLPEGARVGTIDRFQGQEAPIVIYSMTSSSIEDAPRGMDFLLSPNRLNVATSRAKCMVIVVGSSNLMNCDCKTVEQMRRANGVCRYIELAYCDI